MYSKDEDTIATKDAPASPAPSAPPEEEEFAAVTTDVEWSREGTQFRSRSRADKSATLPSGIYTFGQDMFGWFLTRTADMFEFSFKIYPAYDRIIHRIRTYWKTNGGQLGVLLNGLRGAGKTLTAQLLANSLIRDLGLPVLVIKEPVPLQIIFDAIRQDMVVIFDEFEKTHDNNQQQKLLSTIDGMHRSHYKRLCLFTANNDTIDENFKDRPSRIHYQFEFSKIADEITEGLIDDSLPCDLAHLKPDILSYLATRRICTIDIVKATLAEVLTFREAPSDFADMLNISKGEPPAYSVYILEDTGPVVFREFFRPVAVDMYGDETGNRYGLLLSENKRAIQEFKDKQEPVELRHSSFAGNFAISLLDKLEEPGVWLAQLAVPKEKTIWDKFDLYDQGQFFYFDDKPEGWNFPYTVEACKKNAEMQTELRDLFQKSQMARTVYGTNNRTTFKISIKENRKQKFYSYPKV